MCFGIRQRRSLRSLWAWQSCGEETLFLNRHSTQPLVAGVKIARVNATTRITDSGFATGLANLGQRKNNSPYANCMWSQRNSIAKGFLMAFPAGSFRTWLSPFFWGERVLWCVCAVEVDCVKHPDNHAALVIRKEPSKFF